MGSTEATIRGHIRTPAHPPLKTHGGAPRPDPRIEVQVFHAADGVFRTTASMDPHTWEYIASDLPTGDYVVRAHDTKGAYLDTWFPRSPTRDGAEALHVEEGIISPLNKVNVDFHMILVPRLAGQVLTLGPRAPRDIEVVAFDVSTRAEAGRVTGIDDRFSLALPIGRYAVLFHDPAGHFEDQWFSLGTSLETATVVELGVDLDAAQVNVFLVEREEPAGSLSGRVRASDGLPLGQAELVVHDEQQHQVATSAADADGAFRIDGLTPGRYRVAAHSPDHAFLLSWFDRKSALDEADLVTVRSAADTAGIDIVVTKVGGSIHGQTVGPDGSPPAVGVEVRAVPADPAWSPVSTNIRVDGSYKLEHLPPHDYRVVFLPASALLAPQWFNEAASEAVATIITVSIGTASGGVDARLQPPGASISGTVMTGDGGAIPARAWVFASRPDGTYVAQAVIAANGTYTLSDLDPGNYRLDVFLDDPYVKTWFPGVPFEADAGTVSVGLSQARTGIDVRVPIGASIEGRVTTTDGKVLPARVTASAIGDDPESWDETEVAADGHYRLDGLAQGSYIVVITDPGGRYVRRWYPAAADAASATRLTLAAGEVRAGIDVVLEASGVALTGKVSTSDAQPLPANVRAYLALPGTDEPVANTIVAADGSYILRGFGAGTYDLHVQDHSGEHDDALVPNVAVTAALVDLDVVLAVRGSIAGILATSDGNAVPTNILVEAYAASTGDLARQVFATPVAGDYRIGGLTPGDYKVLVRPLGDYAEQWYPAKTSLTDAFAIGVTQGQSVSGIDITLLPE